MFLSSIGEKAGCFFEIFRISRVLKVFKISKTPQNLGILRITKLKISRIFNDLEECLFGDATQTLDI